MNEPEWQQRIPAIGRIARQVANRQNASRTVREELLADAVAHVWIKIKAYDPNKGSFEQWAYVVLRNHCISMIRKEALKWEFLESARTNAELQQEQELRSEPVVSAVVEREEEALRPRFDVVASLERLPRAIDRILLATYSGLIGTCGQGVITRWCKEANCNDVRAFQAIEAMPQTERKQALAKIVGHTNDWVRQRIFRAVQMLKDVSPPGEQS